MRLTVASCDAYRVVMNKQKRHAIVAVVGNPASNNGKGAKAGSRVLDLLNEDGYCGCLYLNAIFGSEVVE